MEDESSKRRDDALQWVYRLAGVATIAGFIYKFASAYDGTLSFFGDAVFFSLGAAFLVVVIGSIIVVTLVTALDYARGNNNPYLQGVYFAFMLAILIYACDFLFLRGEFLVGPTLYPIFHYLFPQSF